jgi:hypothetical protein
MIARDHNFHGVPVAVFAHETARGCWIAWAELGSYPGDQRISTDPFWIESLSDTRYTDELQAITAAEQNAQRIILKVERGLVPLRTSLS